MRQVVSMFAGLANRMFHYSYYLYLRKNGVDCYVDNRYKATTWKMEDVEWNRIFPNAIIRQAPKSLLFKLGGGYGYERVSKYRRKLNLFTSICNIESTPFDFLEPEELKKEQYIVGYYANVNMVESVKEEILEAFKFSEFDNGENTEMAKIISTEQNAVSVHIRKGKDYFKNDIYHNTCTIDYYRQAIAYMNAKLDNPRFFVFTDNIDWVKENFTDFDYTLVDVNSSVGWGNHFDMQLMSLCKHNVIANSSYSFWAAFLNNNKDKIVIAPLYYHNQKLEKYKGKRNIMVCMDWIQM